LFGSWNNVWKNMYANLAAAAHSSVVGRVLTYCPADYNGPGCEKIGCVDYPGREDHFRLLSSIDLVLNSTIADCHPMVELEALSVGTPTLSAPLDLDYGEQHEFKKLFTVPSAHDIAQIARCLGIVAECNPEEISTMVADYRALLTRTSFERYGEFLRG
jgi:hypothetical protein